MAAGHAMPTPKWVAASMRDLWVSYSLCRRRRRRRGSEDSDEIVIFVRWGTGFGFPPLASEEWVLSKMCEVC